MAFPIAFVTGSAHRVGRAFALALAQRGYAIFLHYHASAEQAQATMQEIAALGVPVLAESADLTDAAEIERLFSVMDDWGRNDSTLGPLTVLVNSAGLMVRADARTLSAADWDATLNLNLRAPFLCAQQAYARMQAQGGLIVNITDIAAQKAWSNFPAYTVSKAGLASLTGVLARSFAPKVRVNAIAPGLVLPGEQVPPEAWAKLVERVPLGRMAMPDELTSALLFLLENQYITGQTISVDGGYSLI